MRNRELKVGVWVVLAFGAIACGPEYSDGHVLERVRVLDVRLEPPQAVIGETVSVEALVGAPEGEEIEAAELWACPADSYWPQGCAGAEGAERVEGEMEVGEDWRARATRADPFHVYFIVTAAIEDDAAIKRLVVGLPDEDDPPNTNPVLEEIRIEGSGGAVTIEAVVGEGSVEPYLLRTIDGETAEAEEEMYVSWYASCGTLGQTLSRGARLTTAFSTDGGCTVWAILRDGRGGTDWESVRVEP